MNCPICKSKMTKLIKSTGEYECRDVMLHDNYWPGTVILKMNHEYTCNKCQTKIIVPQTKEYVQNNYKVCNTKEEKKCNCKKGKTYEYDAVSGMINEVKNGEK